MNHNNNEDTISKITVGVWKKILFLIKDLKNQLLILIVLAIALALVESSPYSYKYLCNY